MDALKRIKLTMFMVVNDCLTINSTIVNNLPGYTTNYTILTTNITGIQSAAKQWEFDKSGISDNKAALKKSVASQAYDIASKLVAFANNTANTVLLKEINYSKSNLEHSPDLELKTKAQCIYERANANVSALATYGITAAILTTLLTTINSFNVAIPKPTEGIKEKKQITEQINALFRSTDAALKNIDKIVEIVRTTQPAFYKSYKESRKLPEAGGNTVSFRGMVKDAKSGEGIKGVTLTIVPNDDNLLKSFSINGNGNVLEIVKKTADKGGVIVKSLNAGTYLVKVNKAGYVEQVHTIVINDCELCVLDVQLMRA